MELRWEVGSPVALGVAMVFCIWKAISRESGYIKQRCSFQLGNGERIRFWKDNWCEVIPSVILSPTCIA